MSKRIFRSALAFALVLTGMGVATAQIAPGDSGLGVRLGIHTQNNSGEVGDVTLFARGANRTLVVLNVQGAPPFPQPAHIHRGKCDNLNPVPAYPLNNVVRGRSVTMVNVSEARLLSGNYSVNVHRSTSNLKLYVACGELYR